MKYHVYHKIPLNTIQYDDDDDHNDVFVERELAANDTTLFSIQPKENLSLYYYCLYYFRFLCHYYHYFFFIIITIAMGMIVETLSFLVGKKIKNK